MPESVLATWWRLCRRGRVEVDLEAFRYEVEADLAVEPMGLRALLARVQLNFVAPVGSRDLEEVREQRGASTLIGRRGVA